MNKVELRKDKNLTFALKKVIPKRNHNLLQVSAGVGVENNKLYVIGGYYGQRAEKTCEVHDPTIHRWSTITKVNKGKNITEFYSLGLSKQCRLLEMGDI